MKKQKKWIIGAIIIIAIAFIIAFMSVSSNEIQSSDGFIKVQLFDANGNPINVNSFAIVNNIPNVASMSFTATVENIGGVPLSCYIKSKKVNNLDNANFVLPTDTRYLPSNGKIGFTGITYLEGANALGVLGSVKFNVTVHCDRADTQTVVGEKSGSITLNIQQDTNGDFSVGLGSEGLPTLFCGDGICSSEIGETTTSCNQDCLTVSKVKFRVYDIAYATGNAIAYSSSCGSTLSAYGFVGSTGYLSGNCSSGSKTWCGANPILMLYGLPGEYKAGGSSPSLYNIDSNTVCICDDGSDGKYQLQKYSTTDSDASKVEVSPNQINPVKEINC